MSQFNASSNADSSAKTSTEPSFLVTSSASATATSNVSQQEAQNTANYIAQQIANSVAQNNANIISQTINATTTDVKGKYSYLNITYAVPTDVGKNSTFTGLIFPTNKNAQKNSLVLNYVKPVYYINSLTPIEPPTQKIPDATFKGFYSLTYENDYVNNTSTLSGQRTTYKYIPYTNGYIYNVTVGVNVKIKCNTIITTDTTLADIDGNISSVQIINKMAQGVSTYTPDGNFDKYGGVQLEETYSSDGNWNYITTNFNNAVISGSSNNIYPYVVTQT